jgi:hypothetical protein
MSKLSIYDRAVWYIVLFYLYAAVLVGPIRYLLNEADLIFLAYVPQILTLSLLIWSLLRPKLNAVYILSLCLLLLFTLLGMVYVDKIPQVLFGLYLWTSFLLGIIAYSVVSRNWAKFQRHCLVLSIIVLSGVLLNVRFDFPWVGLDYALGNIDVSVSRLWQTYTFERMAGFSRASFEAATQILLFGLVVMFGQTSHWMRLTIWLAGGIGIVLTTSKGAVAAYLILSGYLLLRRWLPPIFWKALFTSTVLLMVAFPVTVLLLDYEPRSGNTLIRLIFGSFSERLAYIWPEAFAMISQHGNSLIGRGLGGIGTAQHYFEPTLENPADNLFVYLYGIFGLGSLVVICVTIITSYSLRIGKVNIDSFAFALLLAGASYGLTSNVIESPVFSLFLGVTLHHIFSIVYLRSRPVGKGKTGKQAPRAKRTVEHVAVNEKPEPW